MKRHTTLTFLLTTLTLSLLLNFTAALANHPDHPPDKAGIVMWTGDNFTGTAVPYTSSTSHVMGHNNSFKSIQVFGGAKAILYRGPNYGGGNQTYTADDNILSKNDPNLHKLVTSIRVFLPDMSISQSTVDFGNLYHESRDGAEFYNEDQAQTFTLTNNMNSTSNNYGDTTQKTTLTWKISNVRNDVDLFFRFGDISGSSGIGDTSGLSGSLSEGKTATFTVWFDPTSTGTVHHALTVMIRTSDPGNDGDPVISLKATVFDTPTVSRISPALGSNNKVNVAVSELTTFEVASGDPLFPHAKFEKFQWQSQVSGTDPVPASWIDGMTTSKQKQDFSFSSAGDYVVYARMVDNNGVKSHYLSIEVAAWNRPTIADDPPDGDIPTDDNGDGTFSDAELDGKAYWFTNKYVGIKGKTVRLKADGLTDNSNKSEAVAKYEWDVDNDGDTDITQYVGGAFGAFYSLDSGTPRNLDSVLDYIVDNDSAVESGNFDTIDFPNTSGTLKHSNGFSTGLSDYIFAHFTGHIEVTQAGSYQFHIGSDDAFRLKIDGTTVSQFPGPRGFIETGVTHNFSSTGVYAVELQFAEWTVGAGLTLKWTPPSGSKEFIMFLDKSLATHTPSTFDFDGTTSVTAVTNYGIESDAQTFDMKIYESMDVDVGGPYDGVPSFDTALQGTINNLDAYGSNATAVYQWRVSDEAGLAFDGVNDYVAIPNHTDLNTNGPYANRTIGVWFKTSDIAQSEAILFEMGDGANGFNIYIYSDSVYGGAWTDDAGKWLSGQISADTWHHAALVLRESSANLELWLDGTQVDTRSRSAVATHGNGIAIGAINGDTRSHLGTLTGTATNAFAGSIDDVAVFNAALSADEIAEIAGSILGGSETGLVGYWAFDDGEGTTATDSSGGNPGKLMNDPTWPSLTNVTTDPSGGATHTWTTSRDAVYTVEFEATVITSEGLTDTYTDTTTVTIGAGRPIATTGGPYSGGIDGGDNSPTQAEGNFPDTTETDTIGLDITIEEWEWVFNNTVSYNQGVIFSGDDSVSFDDLILDTSIGDLSLNRNSGLTVSVWVKAGFSDGDIVATANDAFSLGLNAGHPVFEVNIEANIDSEPATATSDASIADDGFWHHLVGVYDGEEIHLYLNGYLQESVEVSGTILAGEVSIPTTFVGSVDDLSIWERAISTVERGVLSVGKAANSSKLVGYWPFDEGGGTTVGDQGPVKNDGTLSGSPEWTGETLVTSDIYNPTQTYAKAGEYSVSLRVKADTGRKSTTQETTVTIIDGSIAGTVRAADLRTPVSDVRLTLTSSFVLNGDLSSVVTAGTDINADGSAIYTMTDVDGDYLFDNLPLGSYRLVATKVEEDTTVHEFENPIRVVELTLSSPDQPATDFIDNSVFPVGGRIRSLPYDLDTDNPEVPDDELLVSDVVIEANPIGSTSSVESDSSDTTADATNRNYSLPMFGGKYQFFARPEGNRDIALDSNTPGSELLYTDFDGGVTSAVRLVTITGATSQIHFTDSTKRILTIEVEDSGGFPIQTLADLEEGDDLFNKAIDVDATLSGSG